MGVRGLLALALGSLSAAQHAEDSVVLSRKDLVSARR